MELKAFKGMPHEFGGIDYTEGSEVEGGEFAVQIGKSGNEYIFDKNSSEGERLSKEYKKLDKNGRLTEDDPLALEAFDQIAREEALKHAQRSVNEKGVDPFRNMYEQGGQAANGGVKYATGGPMMNPAEVANVNPGANYNTSQSYAPITMEDYARQTEGESRMRDSFGTQTMRNEPTQKSFREATGAEDFGMTLLDIHFAPITTAVMGEEGTPSKLISSNKGIASTETTQNALGDETSTGTAFGHMFGQTEGVISNMGTQFFSAMSEGGAMPKKKYAAGGASAYLQGFEAIHNMRQGAKQISSVPLKEATANKMGEEWVTTPIAGAPTTTGGGDIMAFKNTNEFNSKTSELPSSPEGTINYGNMSYAPDTMGPFPMDATISQGGTDVPMWKKGGAKPIYGYYANGGGKKANAYEDYLTAREKELAYKAVTEGPYGINYSDVMYGPSYIEGKTDTRTEINNGNVNQSFNQVFENRNIGASSLSPGFDVRTETDAFNGQADQKFFTRNNATGDIYASEFQDGGGKKKEDESYNGMKDPVQWDIMQNYIGSNDTRDRMSQAAVGSGDEMYAPYRLDNTCVAGVNCFEDLAGIPSSEGIPDDIYNNRALRDFFESEEGKKYFRKLSGLESFFRGEKPGDYVQFEKTLDPRGINYPSHIGLTTGKNKYLGDGSEDNSLYYEKIRKDPNVQIAGMEFTNVNPYFYRMLDKKNRQKILEAALQAQEQGKDVIRPAFGDEEPLYLPLQQYRKNTSYPIAGF